MKSSELLDLIGNTPLVELKHLQPRAGIRLFAKLEGQNPSGSVKDRIALALIEAAEQRGDLRPGDTIVEASSGNTAISLAMIAKQRGYKVKAMIPRGVAPSVKDILKMLDVEVMWCEPKAGMKGAIDQAKQHAQDYGYYPLRQFEDPINIQTHYNNTGLEIVKALDTIDVFVAGIGTGGTIMGVGRRLKESHPQAKIIGVEPRMGERLQGLRSLSEGYTPPLLDLSLLNGRFIVESAKAIDTAHSIAGAEGIIAGVSSGATLFAALRVAERIKKGNIVVMFSDGGWKYLPTRPWASAHRGQALLDETHWW